MMYLLGFSDLYVEWIFLMIVLQITITLPQQGKTCQAYLIYVNI